MQSPSQQAEDREPLCERYTGLIRKDIGAQQGIRLGSSAALLTVMVTLRAIVCVAAPSAQNGAREAGQYLARRGSWRVHSDHVDSFPELQSQASQMAFKGKKPRCIVR